MAQLASGVPRAVNHLSIKPEEKMKLSKKASLTFMRPHFVTGILSDGKGNIFMVYISGSKKEVEKFVRYQKRQLSKGVLGINATVEHDDAPHAVPDATISNLTQEKDDKITFTSGKSDKVKIGISRLCIVTKPPYKITYRIDPPIQPKANLSVGLNQTYPADFAVEFDGSVSNITCTVQTGMVEFKLIEVDTGLIDGPYILEDLPPNNLKTIAAHASGNLQKWRAEVIGRRPGKESRFELEYVKKYA
jgi:hypothetical protein